MSDICVCAEEITSRGLFPCGHAFCLECVLKHRVLMKDLNCSYCRSPAKSVAVVESDGEFKDAKIPYKAGHLKVQNEQLVQKLDEIMAWTCTICGETCANHKQLRQHVSSHDKRLCDCCVKSELKFSGEFVYYSVQELKSHIKSRHVRCKYCQLNFYDNQSFSKHCKQEHMGCLVCERRDPEHLVYYKDYDALYDHYREKHYMCMVSQCLEDKHIVFATKADLGAHMSEAHKGLIKEFNILEPLEPDAKKTTPKTEPIKETSANVQYDLRLEIAANHDSAKIEQIRAANNTFLSGKVPANVFIMTYESVLKPASKSEITHLLSTFAKSENQETPHFKSLSFSLFQREELEEKEHQPDKNSTLPPTRIAQSQWGANLNTTGSRVSLKTLPTLGSAPKKSKLPVRPAISAPVRQVAVSNPVTQKWSNLPQLSNSQSSPTLGRPTPARLAPRPAAAAKPALNALPQLKSTGHLQMASKPQITNNFMARPTPKTALNKPKQQPEGLNRQTSIPLSQPAFSSRTLFQRHESYKPAYDSDEEFEPEPEPEPVLQQSKPKRPPVNRLNLNSLPSLPSSEKKTQERKRVRNVVRIV